MTDTIIVLQNEREEAGTMILKKKNAQRLKTYRHRKKAALRNMADMHSRQKILS